MTTTATLQDLIYSKGALTEPQKQQLYDLVAPRCKEATKTKLYHKIFKVPLEHWQMGGLFYRVLIDHNGDLEYCTGQDWTYECRILREQLL